MLHLSPEQEKNDSYFHDAVTGVRLEIVERMTLVEWLANNYKSFGAALEFITDRSQEGSQFCRGFGGIGGLLRWKVSVNCVVVVLGYVCVRGVKCMGMLGVGCILIIRFASQHCE